MEPVSRHHLLARPARSTGGRHSRPGAGVKLHYAEAPQGQGSLATALDLASHCLPPTAHVVATDAALNKGLVRLTEIEAFTLTSRARHRALLRDLDGHAESPLETLTRLALRAAGLRTASQVHVTGVGRVDLLVEGRVIVELDGMAYHSDRRAFVEDRRRDRVTQLGNRTVLRYTYEDVMLRMELIIAEVSHAALRPVL
ncbi:endonuclease domain-containing protein [Demequina sp. NBRC 110054]|uniref:endonuclease domain-containing protein n=1 Tax=Demequina sp. NBRC 110054 TaxID=1570343 RepID=UPI001F2A8EED|nr:DUF559 domain-containing protein [Demequina sp. NBRC 110054]